jgi:uncharacterized protein YdeI (YjbR/CyaY-like superfamily)
MGKRDPRIDAYIAKQAEFAKPILMHLRAVVHEGCPECEETLKWSSPTFMYHGILVGIAAFKQHVAFGFWKHDLVVGGPRRGEAGSFGHITSLKDLPPKREIIELIRKAMKLNEEGVKAPMARKGPRKAIPMPPDFQASLVKSRKAKKVYDDFSPSAQREYLEWITDAKTGDTRLRRIAQAVEWIAEGKTRNWKYK